MSFAEDVERKTVKLPEGTTLLELDRSEAQPDVELALDLARKGASPMLVRAVGGEASVRQVKQWSC